MPSIPWPSEFDVIVGGQVPGYTGFEFPGVRQRAEPLVSEFPQKFEFLSRNISNPYATGPADVPGIVFRFGSTGDQQLDDRIVWWVETGKGSLVEIQEAIRLHVERDQSKGDIGLR